MRLISLCSGLLVFALFRPLSLTVLTVCSVCCVVCTLARKLWTKKTRWLTDARAKTRKRDAQYRREGLKMRKKLPGPDFSPMAGIIYVQSPAWQAKASKAGSPIFLPLPLLPTPLSTTSPRAPITSFWHLSLLFLSLLWPGYLWKILKIFFWNFWFSCAVVDF